MFGGTLVEVFKILDELGYYKELSIVYYRENKKKIINIGTRQQKN